MKKIRINNTRRPLVLGRVTIRPLVPVELTDVAGGRRAWATDNCDRCSSPESGCGTSDC
jgi:hypothetical protein